MAVSEISLREACENFSSLISRVKDKEEFIDWLHSVYFDIEECAKPMFVQDTINKLREIASHIRTRLPNGIVASEKIKWPSSGHDADCVEKNTVHVDCFLYDDYELDEMMKSGKFERRYCFDCGSRNIKDLNIISHSLAHCQLEFMFTQLVPLKSQRHGFRVLDIGSRLGAVIYAASIYGCGNILVTGIEMNEDFVKLQRDVIRDFCLQNIDVVCADVRSRYDLVNQADLIVMNNVFSFFFDTEEQAECFEFIHKYAKKNCFIIHNPDIETATAHLKLSFAVNEWIEKVSTESICEMFADGDVDVLSDCKTLSLYRVL